jgi:glucose-1-phosphate adenylyltransferase
VRKAIIDQDVTIPNGFSIGYDAESDKKLFSISPGKVVVVPRGISLVRGAKG